MVLLRCKRVDFEFWTARILQKSVFFGKTRRENLFVLRIIEIYSCSGMSYLYDGYLLREIREKQFVEIRDSRGIEKYGFRKHKRLISCQKSFFWRNSWNFKDSILNFKRKVFLEKSSLDSSWSMSVCFMKRLQNHEFQLNKRSYLG